MFFSCFSGMRLARMRWWPGLFKATIKLSGSIPAKEQGGGETGGKSGGKELAADTGEEAGGS